MRPSIVFAIVMIDMQGFDLSPLLNGFEVKAQTKQLLLFL